MLDYYFRDRKKLAAMEHNPLAPYLAQAAARYRADGYALKYAQRSLSAAARFGEWLGMHRVPPARIIERHVDEFLRWFVPRPPDKFIYRRKLALAAVRFVVALIPDRPAPTPPPSPAQAEVGRYIEHLRHNRGMAEGTLEIHRRNLEQFLTSCFKRQPVVYLAITAAEIHAYVGGLPHGLSNSMRRQTCAALRGYFRFLQMHGAAVGRLQAAVPTVRRPRAALSPKWLTPGDADQLLRSIDRSTATGKRNYAAILCMMDLGLRVGDVARLSLDAIDWRGGTVRAANHKRARPYRLPLPRRLGKALADYLSKGRPSSQRREVFLSHAHPRGAPATDAALKRMMWYAWRRAGLGERFSGTHILRHSVATRMKQEGVSLKLIADVLGHQAVQTTTLYAQVDLPALRRVAQPWPEVRS